MIRFLLPLFLVVGVIWWLKVLGRGGSASNTKANKPDGKTPALPMVVCAQCGTHLPKPEALSQQGQWFCCTEHRDQHDPRAS